MVNNIKTSHDFAIQNGSKSAINCVLLNVIFSLLCISPYDILQTTVGRSARYIA